MKIKLSTVLLKFLYIIHQERYHGDFVNLAPTFSISTRQISYHFGGISYYFFVKCLMKGLAYAVRGSKINLKLFVFKCENHTQYNELLIPKGDVGLCPTGRTVTPVFHLSFMMQFR